MEIDFYIAKKRVTVSKDFFKRCNPGVWYGRLVD